LCFVDHASRQIRVMKTNLMYCLSSVYFASHRLHVSGIFVAYHQEVYCIYTQQLVRIVFFVDCLLAGLGWNPTNRQSAEKHNTYKLLYIYSIPPDDGLQICPKPVEADWRNKLRINSESSWFSLHGICYVLLNPIYPSNSAL
jgi:hypothetical protein